MGRNDRKAVLIHLAFWSAQTAIQTQTRKPGTKVYRIDGGFPAHEYPEIIYRVDNDPETRNEPVRLLKKYRAAYSASAGDVIKIGRKYFLCLMMGWKEMTRPDFLQYLRSKYLLPNPSCP